jgi:hypothetical protein
VSGAADDARRARAWLLAAGSGHGALALALAVGGHRPSGPTPLGAHHFLVQGFLEPLLFLAMGRALGGVAHRVALGLGGAGDRAALQAALAPALAAPVLLCLALPEGLAYALGGLEGVRAVMPACALAALALSLRLGTRAVGRTHRLPAPRAAVVALAGLVAAALVGAPLIR